MERVAEAAPTEETGEQTGEQRVADRNAQSVKETLRFHKQKMGRGMGSPIPGLQEGAWTREGPKFVDGGS